MDQAHIIGQDVFDGAIRASRDFARGDHIPEGNVMVKQQSFFVLNRLWLATAQHRRKNFPKTILRMPIEKGGLAGFDRGKATQNQHAGILIIYGWDRMCRHGRSFLQNGMIIITKGRRVFKGNAQILWNFRSVSSPPKMATFALRPVVIAAMVEKS